MPNIFTVFNMYLGFSAIILLISGEPIQAAWFVFFAGILDAFDGKLARLLGIDNTFGTEFDSFADTISFCATSSILIYTIWTVQLHQTIAIALSFIPLVFGTIRLAKFNIQTERDQKPYFKGLPTPPYSLILFGFLVFSNQKFGTYGDPQVALALVIILGFAMLSPIRFGKIPYLSFKRGSMNNIRLSLGILVIISIIIFKGFVLFPALILYVIWSFMDWIIHPDKSDLITNLSTSLSED